MSNNIENSDEYEIEEEYKEVINNIIKNIFEDKYTLTNEDYKLFDQVRNHKSVSENNYEIHSRIILCYIHADMNTVK